MLGRLATLWLGLVLLVSFPVGYVLGLLLLAASAPVDPQRHALHHFLSQWCHRYIQVWPLWRVRVEGASRLPPGPCVLIANHQSMADVLAVMGLPVAFKFVSKASLFQVPLIGFMMRRLGHVSLERGARGSTLAMMDRCLSLLKAGEKVLIFPEATYAPADRRLPFRRGAFTLARRAGVPVVPLVVLGTRELIDGDGPWFGGRADVLVRVEEPLPMPEDDEAWVREAEGRYHQWLGV